MKSSQLILLFSALVFVEAKGQSVATNSDGSENSTYIVVERGADHRLWQKTDYETLPSGQKVPHVHEYTELATGLNFWEEDAKQWVESKEQIDILSNGTAAATNGQHQAYLPGDIYTGEITLVTPDGKHLQSRPLGLAYDDGTKSLLIAELTNSVGELLPSGNQVLYPGAFTGLAADIRYTYTRAGFEQDIILHEQPPDPTSLGLNPKTTRLQVLTEFFDPPQPAVAASSAPSGIEDLTDDTLDFGAMRMTRGKAFFMGTTSHSVQVHKRWVFLDGRQFLVEEVPLARMTTELQSLPLRVSQGPSTKPGHLAAGHLLLPAKRMAQTTPKPVMLLAKAPPSTQGLVLDYNTINGGLTNYTFQGDATYYISGPLVLYGTNTFEGGTVLKYTNNASLDLSSCQINWLASTYRPVIFTAIDDNSVGEIINGSTGTPTNYYANPAINYFPGGGADPGNLTLSNFRIAYANQAIWASSYNLFVNLSDGQIVNCGLGFYTPGQTQLSLKNMLFANFQLALQVFLANVHAQNVTFAAAPEGPPNYEAAFLIAPSEYYNPLPVSVDLQNCIIANCVLFSAAGPILTINGDHNGFYNNGQSPFGTSPFTTSSNPFQIVGEGNYYLANGSPFQGVGATNIDPTLLADLPQKTTYPPLVYSNTVMYGGTYSPQAIRDTNATPDLGYHYAPLDYVFGGVDNYSTLSFTPGTVVGWFNTVGTVGTDGYGFSLSDGSTAVFQGLVGAPCVFAPYNAVQEGGTTNWTQQGTLGGILFNGDTGNPPILTSQFTMWDQLAGDGSHFQDNGAYGVADIEDSEFYNGSIYSTWSFDSFTNCMFQRVNLNLASTTDGSSAFFRNCTFWNGGLLLTRLAGQDPASWTILDSAFDGTTNVINDGLSGNPNYTYIDYNAFRTNADWTQGSHDVTVTDFGWQTSWLGTYYLPPDSGLIDHGNTNANYVGLYHFTTQTNQVKETNSVVDIGYHYVAVDIDGYPICTSGNGIPDYVADSNGDGVYDTGDYSDWLDYYSGNLPNLNIIEGDQQRGPLGAFLPTPLMVNVTDGYGNTLTNAPLTFSVTNGLNQLALSESGTLVSNLPIRTDANGNATVYLYLPPEAPITNIVIVTATTEGTSEQIIFNCQEGQVDAPDISPPGGTFTSIQTATLSCDTTNAAIHYTIDGTDPTESSPTATNGQSIYVGWTMTINAAAFEDGVLLPSDVTTANFTIIHPIAAGRKHTLVLKPDGSMLAGGSGGDGQIGDGTTHLRTNLVSVVGVSNVIGIAAGELFSYAWTADGSAWSLAWGDDRNGESGEGVAMHRQTNAIQINNLAGVVDMSAGNHHGLAVDTNGLVWTWGLNNWGQLGTNVAAVNRLDPMPMTNFSGVVAVAAGSWHSLALKTNGTVWGWGKAENGEVGDGSLPYLRTIPVKTYGLTNVSAIAAGYNSSMAISNGTVWMWGANQMAGYEYVRPTRVSGLSNIVAIAAGYYHNLALKADGTVWAWGYNGVGQLGDGTYSTRYSPVRVVGLSNVLAIAAGGQHSAAIKSDGTIVLWGYVNYGEEAAYSRSPITPEPTVAVDWVPPAIISQPLSQEVLQGDSVMFSVVASGADLTYQWSYNGNPISGATSTSYTISAVQNTDAGNYSVTVANGMDQVVSSNAVLTVDAPTGDPNLMVIQGPRQNYTFKDGVTYYIYSPVVLYGTNTIQGGAVLKFDYDNEVYYGGLPATMQVFGTLNCQTGPYNPAVLTSVDDDAEGEFISWDSNGPLNGGYLPFPVPTGVPYLDLTLASNSPLSNLRISYADQGVVTPAGQQLDVWDCQFLQCNSAVLNLLGGTNSFHNVLFAGCSNAVQAATNSFAIAAEQVTADVTNFYVSTASPAYLRLTNSIVLTGLSGALLENSTVNASWTNFQANGVGNYYLSTNSPLHASGTTGISARLVTEFQNKTTYPPIVLPDLMQLSNSLTLVPQALRYTNGAPDAGYYYDPLDYTVAGMLVIAGGSVSVQPGTAVGLRNDVVPSTGNLTYIGFDLQEGSSFTSDGTPNKPNVFVDVQDTQEEFQWPVMGSFVPDYFPNTDGWEAPDLAFRFSDFYLGYAGWLGAPAYHFWSGISLLGFEWSVDSSMFFDLQDSKVHGGQIDLGLPDNPDFGYGYFNYDYVYGPAAVSWDNNSFEEVSINLSPTYYQYGYDDLGLNVDMLFKANNNLFRNGDWLDMEPVPGWGTNWIFVNNLFDKVDFLQDTNMPLFYDYNAYWPKLASELLWSGDAAEFQQPSFPGNPICGTHDVILTAAPPYQSGPFGNYYLPTTTPLYNAGSDTAANLGLYHYTTRLDQLKEGNEPSGHKVNIGVHYVAAANGVPIDTDGDGIPDFWEDANGNGRWDPGESQVNVADANQICPDGTGQTFLQEWQTGDYFNKRRFDFDNDGISNLGEYFMDTDPFNAYSQDPTQTHTDGLWYFTAVTGQAGTRAQITVDWADSYYDPSSDSTILNFAVSGITASDQFDIYIQTPSVDLTDPTPVWQDMFLRFGYNDLGFDSTTGTHMYQTAWIGDVTSGATFAALDSYDRDFDGLPDGYEVMAAHTAVGETSSAGDGMADGDDQPQHDGLTAIQKMQYGLNPSSVLNTNDTAGVGMPDWFQNYITVWDGSSSAGAWADADGDNVPNIVEFDAGTDPTIPDNYGYFPPPSNGNAEFASFQFTVPYGDADGPYYVDGNGQPHGNPYLATFGTSLGMMGNGGMMDVQFTPNASGGGGVANMDFEAWPLDESYDLYAPFSANADNDPADSELQEPSPSDGELYRNILFKATDIADHVWTEINPEVLEALSSETLEYVHAVSMIRISQQVRHIQYLEQLLLAGGDRAAILIRVRGCASIIHTEITKVTAIELVYLKRFPNLDWIDHCLHGASFLACGASWYFEWPDLVQDWQDYESDVRNQVDYGAADILSSQIQLMLLDIPGLPVGVQIGLDPTIPIFSLIGPLGWYDGY